MALATQSTIDFDAPAQRHSPTSVAAAVAIAPHLPAARAKVLATTDGYEVLIDEADFALVSRFRWRTRPGVNTRYAIRQAHGDKTMRLHRELLCVPADNVVDHINGNGLDNRRANLRICTKAENNRNTSKRGNGASSQFKGVVKRTDCNRFSARIMVGGIDHYIGTFKSERRAAVEYDLAAMELHGEFAFLNFGGEFPADVWIEVRQELVDLGLVRDSGRVDASGSVVWEAVR